MKKSIPNINFPTLLIISFIILITGVISGLFQMVLSKGSTTDLIFIIVFLLAILTYSLKKIINKSSTSKFMAVLIVFVVLGIYLSFSIPLAVLNLDNALELQGLRSIFVVFDFLLLLTVVLSFLIKPAPLIKGINEKHKLKEIFLGFLLSLLVFLIVFQIFSNETIIVRSFRSIGYCIFYLLYLNPSLSTKISLFSK